MGLFLFATLIAFISLVVSIRFLFLAIDIFFQEVPQKIVYRIHPIHGIIAIIVYWIAMVLMVPYLVVVMYSPRLWAKWVSAHRSSLKRVFKT